MRAAVVVEDDPVDVRPAVNAGVQKVDDVIVRRGQRDAQAALEATQRNRAEMDRMFERSMRK